MLIKHQINLRIARWHSLQCAMFGRNTKRRYNLFLAVISQALILDSLPLTIPSDKKILSEL